MRALIYWLMPALLWLAGHSMAIAQRKTAPPLENCQATPAPVNNEIMTSGMKKYYSGAAVTFSNLTLRGATLVVCSQLTITNLTVDSGTIVIRPGAKLTAGGGGSGMIWRGGCALYNYGTFEITTNLSLEGNDASAARPNILMNVTSAAVISDDFNYFVINNAWSYFINNGKASFGGIITDNNASAGSVCLGSASETKQRILINKVKDAYVAPQYNACVHVTTMSQFADTLTDHNRVLVCLASGHTSVSGGTNKPNAWGSANLFTNCSACSGIAILPQTSHPLKQVPERPASETSVFPSPFTTLLQIRSGRGKVLRSVVVHGAGGQVVWQNQILTEAAGNQIVINSAGWPSGIYHVRLIYAGSVSNYKVMKIAL